MAASIMNVEYTQHTPVLLQQVVTGLVTSPQGIYVDATFGRGSHAHAILQRLNQDGLLIAFDKDPDAVAYAKKIFKHEKRFMIFHCSFADMQMVLNELSLSRAIQGVFFDLGVSSPQLDDPNRGFSFSQDGKLDMRMDSSSGISAAEWLANIAEEDLANVIWRYGEERASRRIARAIVAARKVTPIVGTKQLAEIISKAAPKTKKNFLKHPATRSFQAIRIAVNHELSDLEKGLEQALEVLKIGGRLAAISFHSLEDRMVKHFIREHEKGRDIPRGLPIKISGLTSRLKTIGRAIKPSKQETDMNPRSRSAILRIAEKLS